MKLNSKIYVAGHRGLVGSAIVSDLKSRGYANLVLKTHAELDLINQSAVRSFFEREKPEFVFLAAARVGGILANSQQPAEFIYDNLMIESNVIHQAYKAGVQKLLFLGSSCIYPKLASQPISESELLTGALESTNEAYAVAKITGVKMCGAYNKQFGTNFVCVMPANLYGPNDSFDLNQSHVLPALIRKIHEAKLASASEVVIWGSGKPKREFLFSADLAQACVFLMEKVNASDIGEIVNVGTGQDMMISELAGMIAEIVGYSGKFVYDSSKPDGAPRKVLNVDKMSKLGWSARTDLRSGIQATYKWFLQNLPKC